LSAREIPGITSKRCEERNFRLFTKRKGRPEIQYSSELKLIIERTTSEMNRKHYVRNREGKIIGRHDGNWIRDGTGKLVARYDEADNRTRDRNGKIVGAGD